MVDTMVDAMASSMDDAMDGPINVEHDMTEVLLTCWLFPLYSSTLSCCLALPDPALFSFLYLGGCWLVFRPERYACMPRTTSEAGRQLNAHGRLEHGAGPCVSSVKPEIL